MSKKIKFIIVGMFIILLAFTTKNFGYSADTTLITTDKMQNDGIVNVTLKLENINATQSGVSVIKGRVEFDKDVFENYTVETNNGWSYKNQSNTFLFENANGITSNQTVAVIKFKVKSAIAKEESKIRFSNITVSGITAQQGGPGDIKVAGATITVSKTAEPKIDKENITNTNNGGTSTTTKTSIKSSKSTDNSLPYAGIEDWSLILGAALLVISIVLFIKYNWYKKYIK